MKVKFLASFLIFFCVLVVFAQIPREDFWASFGLYTLLFFLYTILIYLALKLKFSLGQILIMTLLTRLVFFFGPPLHSDDYFRFFWDGQLVLHQINPYVNTPQEMVDAELLPPLLEPVYVELNSPNYHSVYPLTNQVVFAIAAWLGGASISGFIIWLRAFLVFFDILGVWVLCQLLVIFKLDPRKALLYALNPLILLEITGNLHFEGMMLTFIFLGLWALARQKVWMSGAWIGMAVSVKLTPLIILPFFLKYLNLKNFSLFISATALIIGIFFIPFFWVDSAGNFLTSLQLYYGKFEFNASIYYLLRGLGFVLKGYNVIESLSIWLSLLVFLAICYAAWRFKIFNLTFLTNLSLLAYFIYLFLSMVVHPWYIIPLLGLGIISGKFSPIVWSFFIYLSYYAYSVDHYRENYFLLYIQYGAVFFVAFVEYYPSLYPNKNKSICKS